MTPFQKQFTKEYAKELLRVAQGDLRTAKVLVDHPGGRTENTFFLIQQSLEKAFKAVICHHGLPVPLTHDLGALLAMLPNQISTPPESKALVAFTEFASIRRYEEGKYVYLPEEISNAYRIGEAVLNWASGIIV